MTFAAGLACEGMKPVVAIYSTFLQRAYDQLIHDVALQNLPVVFAIDRAGIVGADGATHMGAFDLSYLRCLPNMTVMAPADENECRQMLYTAFKLDTPTAVRYPRGSGPRRRRRRRHDRAADRQGRGAPHDVAAERTGSRSSRSAACSRSALGAAEELDATVANMRFVKPLDVDLVSQLALEHDMLVTIEENVVAGGAGSAVGEALAAHGILIPLLAARIARRVRRPRRSGAAPRRLRARRPRRRRVRQRAVRTAADGPARASRPRRRRHATTPMRPIAIFRFSRTEGPAYFADWLDARGLAWQLVALDEGAPMPVDPRAFAGIALMGGPMSVNDGLPWQAPLSALLRAAVDRDDPGARPLPRRAARSRRRWGRPVTRAPVAEIGWLDVDVCDDAARREWFGGRAAFTTFEWHYDAFALPAGATPVLTNAFNAHQAYVVGGRHIGFQCHIEMTEALVETWLASGADELPAQSTPATQSAADIRRDLAARVAALHRVADDVYARWAQGLAR